MYHKCLSRRRRSSCGRLTMSSSSSPRAWARAQRRLPLTEHGCDSPARPPLHFFLARSVATNASVVWRGAEVEGRWRVLIGELCAARVGHGRPHASPMPRSNGRPAARRASCGVMEACLEPALHYCHAELKRRVCVRPAFLGFHFDFPIGIDIPRVSVSAASCAFLRVYISNAVGGTIWSGCDL